MKKKEIDEILNDIDTLDLEIPELKEIDLEKLVASYKKKERFSFWQCFFHIFILAVFSSPVISVPSGYLIGPLRIILFLGGSYLYISHYLFKKKMREQDKSSGLEEFLSLRHRTTQFHLKSLSRGRILFYPILIWALISNSSYAITELDYLWGTILIVFSSLVGFLVFKNIENSILELKETEKSLK